jgi:hypothetical protein
VNVSSVPIAIPTEGTTTVSFFATDNAGNVENSKQVVVMLDKTPPAIICGAAAGVWHAADVSIPCTASDAGSGLANSSDANFVLSTAVPVGTETAGAPTVTHSVCDVAGNCANAGPIGGNMVDKKPPAIGISVPSQTSYLLKQAINANYACTDGGSGVATCTGTAANGSSIDTSSVGGKTFMVNASDRTGNTSSQSVTYQVICHYLTFTPVPSSLAAGGITTVNVKLMSCAGMAQTIVIQFTLTGPAQGSCGATNTVMFTSPPIPLPANTLRTFSFPARIPTPTCVGTYTLLATTRVNGVAVDTSTATLTVH